MKYLFYTTSETAWDGLFEAMQAAQKSIYLEMYIFVDDTEKENDFISLLSAKARAGVSVRMILDMFGSADLSDKARKELEDAGVELLFFRKWFRRLHKKIVIVDEKVGFLGGVNIHQSARLWSDLLIRLQGPIVHSLIRSFKRTYRTSGGRDQYVLSFKKKAVLGHTRIWLFEHIPDLRQPRLRDIYTESILKAKKQLILVTPYFLPHKWLIQLLKETVARGVEVQVIVPTKTDLTFITRANRFFVNLLAGDGITFFETPKMNHAKLLLIDENLALVGSQNIDAMSFDFNAEVGVFFNDKKMIHDLFAIVDGWRSAAQKITTPSKNITWDDKLFSFLIRALQPLL